MRLRFTRIGDFVNFPNPGLSKVTEDWRTPVVLGGIAKGAGCIYCSCFVDDFARDWIAHFGLGEVVEDGFVRDGEHDVIGFEI